jgi:hypothetical protein
MRSDPRPPSCRGLTSALPRHDLAAEHDLDQAKILAQGPGQPPEEGRHFVEPTLEELMVVVVTKPWDRRRFELGDAPLEPGNFIEQNALPPVRRVATL